MSDKKKQQQQRDLLSFWAKPARSEETVEEALDLSVNDRAEEHECPEGTEDETEDDDVEEIKAPEDTEDETAEETEDDDVEDIYIHGCPVTSSTALPNGLAWLFGGVCI
ncbi:hypothetical protein CgunFtcFv8_000741 [Champsocephalus gunnari]|uniref:Uncharacterized protein n=1 Tax=Champsocephalus gunnari TaxID=52237 RepID=A0AAN8DPF1_CHAGU|nr:hypothetical protein CgunFtcFv8_000740 [Champsocephalus gunnari]KAK5923805.1 hypothetical protein CgunFtcFv8_000741 [Champsocephalus gunnari]